MKKISILVAVVAAFSFASCKKDRTCTCVDTTTVLGSTTSNKTTTVETFHDSKKGNAKEQCVSATTTVTGTGYVATVVSECELD